MQHFVIFLSIPHAVTQKVFGNVRSNISSSNTFPTLLYPERSPKLLLAAASINGLNNICHIHFEELTYSQVLTDSMILMKITQ